MKDRCVIKIGGSVLKDDSILPYIRDIILHFEKPVVVVSAFSGITDALYRLYERRECREERLRDLLLMHLGMLHKYQIKADLHILPGSGGIEDEESYVAFGEKMSAFTLASYLTGNGIPAAPVYTDEAGIVVNDASWGREVDIDGSKAFYRNIARIERNGRIPVVTGFFGADQLGNTRILGRNSSDYSAVAIAAILGIRNVILIKDVPGIYLNLGDRTSLVSRMDYDTALRIINGGSRVVHEAAIKLAMKKGINLVITSLETIDHGTFIGDPF
ncbi:hypothetical protein [Thermoplasma sp.]|uniref:amino acid kinase family protein n=1 Tax=Thermoplasma sp. TaxID=1973142 RepID=UPI0012761BE9|nr:hypothetical protein [Thermoplasma sp.]KAA8922813.1 MAG: aspartate kinase [Thermoplasma sp.]